MTRTEERRAANRRTGLMLAAVAFTFFLIVIIEYEVLGP
ncbi:cytochrome oxidase small assembly protein [Thauera sp.]